MFWKHESSSEYAKKFDYVFSFTHKLSFAINRYPHLMYRIHFLLLFPNSSLKLLNLVDMHAEFLMYLQIKKCLLGNFSFIYRVQRVIF